MSTRRLIVLVGLFVAIAVGARWALVSKPTEQPTERPKASRARRPPRAPLASHSKAQPSERVSEQAPPRPPVGSATTAAPWEATSEPRPPASPVDLEALQALLPENLYWRFGVPTDDPAVAEERERFNGTLQQVFGRIQSNTATEEEIDWYYDHKEALSRDYLELSQTVLQTHGDELPLRERGLYELSVSMHTHRLSEYPAHRSDAKRRKKLQDEKREAWQASQ